MVESAELTLWREVLKAELLLSEQRQREYFDARIELKASKEHVELLERRAVKQDMGEFTTAQVLSMEHLLAAMLETRLVKSRALRSNWATWLVASCAVVSLVLSLGFSVDRVWF